VTATLPERRTRFRSLPVRRIDSLCDDAAALTFGVPPEYEEEFRFRPGQSITVRRVVGGREERRSYSICSAAGHLPRIGVRELADGHVSGWLVHDISVGDLIDVLPPSGSFTPELRSPQPRSRQPRSAELTSPELTSPELISPERAADHAGEYHVLIAAGSGITPVLSIASTLLADTDGRVTVCYGNRRTDTVMFADEIADLKDAYPARFQLVHVLSREPQEVELFSGRMDAAKLLDLLPAVTDVGAVDHWWLCGPYGMVVDATRVLGEFSVAPNRIHRELFYVEDVAPDQEQHVEPAASGAVEVTVMLDGRATTASVPADAVVLDAAQRVRPDLPFACKGGVCGTCRARLVSGKVRMRRNFALEEAELAAGFVLTCQAVPDSGTVILDYDA
jgi:ring-1,2-phenylacetyl-CoA epoxidase subunit PaaE